MGILRTHMVTISHSNGEIVASMPLPVTMVPVNLSWNMEVGGMVPVDYYDVTTCGWASPVPLRTDYLTDQNGVKYSMFSTVDIGQNMLQFRVSKSSGNTP